MAGPTSDTSAVIQVSGLTKSYGDVRAVAGIDLRIARGEVFALLGPNGAGKTTAIGLAFQRDAGVLKRTNGTPLPSAVFFTAKVLHALLVSVLLVAITVVFGKVVYQAEVPTGAPLFQFLVILMVGAASFCALGFAITAVIPNADAAAPIVNATILPLMFLSGVFIPIGDNAPAWITWVARIFPVKHFADGIQAGFLGTAFHWTDVLVVGAWGIASLLLSMRYFSWEPRT